METAKKQTGSTNFRQLVHILKCLRRDFGPGAVESYFSRVGGVKCTWNGQKFYCRDVRRALEPAKSTLVPLPLSSRQSTATAAD